MGKLFIALVFVTFIHQMSLGQTDENSSVFVKGTSFSLFTNEDIDLDFKFIDPAKGFFGIDHQVQLSRPLASLNKDTLQNLQLDLTSKGFITVNGDVNPINSIISGFHLKAFPLWKIGDEKDIASNEKDWRDYMELPEGPVEDDPLITEATEFAQSVSSPLWFFAGVHFQHETTQSFKDYNFAVGAQLNLTTSYLNFLLDLPFSLLRSNGNNNPRQLDITIGYDYVMGLENTKMFELKDSTNFMNRLHFKAEWETGIFSGKERVAFLFNSYYDINPTDLQVTENKAWNLFYMIKLERLLSVNPITNTATKVAIKYTQGAIPPNFNDGYVLGGGFTLEF